MTIKRSQHEERPMQFLIGTLIAFAALAVAYFTLIHQKRGSGFKRIHYTVFYELLSLNRGEDGIDELIDGPISVNLEPSGRRLILPIAFKLKLSNTGNAPIVSGDFVGPITINFGEHCNFVGGTIDCSPYAVSDVFKLDGFSLENGRLKINPFLLNVGDEITLSGILNGIVDDDGITLSGRIAGVDTFTRLENKDGGIQLKAEVRSMVYELMSDWPEGCAADAKVFIMPKFLPLDEVVPGSSRRDGITTRFNGVRVDNMHAVNFLFQNTSSEPLNLGGAPIKFESESSVFHYMEVFLNDERLSGDEVNRLLDWDPNLILIRIGQLLPEQPLLVKFICAGDASDLKISSRPKEIEDVQVFRTKVVDDPLGKNMLGMQPHILLMSRRIHRKVHLEIPQIIIYWDKVKSWVRRIVHGD